MHYCRVMSNTVLNGEDPAETPSTVQSVDRAITILEILARTGESGVTELAGELGVHKSTAFRWSPPSRSDPS